MSIWKSPVFYFGVVLLLVISAALAAPYVVPWNNYRADLENYGARLTGREVSIGGNIDVTLFPWPQLSAQNVAIGNPAGFSDAAFVKADEVRVTLSLAGLFNGSLDVESVEATAPQVNLQRNASGDVNWIFAPSERVVGSGLLSRVQLDQITVKQGIVSYDDLRNGHSAVFTGFNAALSSQSIVGPWRMRGDAKWNDIPVALTLSTNTKEENQPLRFAVKVSPLDAVYPHIALDGAWDSKSFAGNFRIDPQDVTGEKTSAEGALKPLSLQADVSASDGRMSLLKIRIAPADRKDSGTLIEGDAVFEFGSRTTARIDLKSPRINLDTLLGAGTMQSWRDGGFLSVTNGLMMAVPAKFEGAYSLAVNNLTSGGQSLNNVRINGVVQREAIRINQLTADLPGRSGAVFDGVIFPGENLAQLAGVFKLQSGDTRALVSWLAPQMKENINTFWTGSRGRLDVQSGKVEWTRDRFALTDVAFQFEGVPGDGVVTADWASSPKLEVQLSTGAFNLDDLVPGGVSVFQQAGLLRLTNHFSAAAPTWTQNLRMQAKSVLANGTKAQDVAFDLSSSPTGFEVKAFDIGNVSGARLQGRGTLARGVDGPEGEVAFRLDADDPIGFMRLLGVAASDTWRDALGTTAMDLQLKAVPQKSGQELQIVMRGNSGEMALDVLTTLRELEKGAEASVASSGTLSSKTAKTLFQLFGFETDSATNPAAVSFDLNGTVAKGFAVAAKMNALQTGASFDGRFDPRQPWLGLDGKVVVNAADGSALLGAIGAPVNGPQGQPLDVSMMVKRNEATLEIQDISAAIVGRRITGVMAIAPGLRITGDLEANVLTATDVFSLALMPWNGPVADLATGFAGIEDRAPQFELFVRPQQFDPVSSEPVSEVVVAIGGDGQSRNISVAGAGENAINLDMTMNPRGASFEATGQLRWPVALAKVVATAQGQPLMTGQALVQGRFAGSGRSPAALFASLSGDGTYGLSNAIFTQLTLKDLARNISDAKTPEALSLAFKTFSFGAGTAVGERVGDVKIANGEATFAGFELQDEQVVSRSAVTFDIPGDGLSVASTVTVNGLGDVPPITVDYAGVPGALSVRNGTSALAAKLGYALLAREMEELERLQKEQDELTAREEAQRQSDEQRFFDYKATRVELRKAAQMRRFHAAQRVLLERQRTQLIQFIEKNGAALTRSELTRHARRLAVRRQGPL
jgi:hypothetical protein